MVQCLRTHVYLEFYKKNFTRIKLFGVHVHAVGICIFHSAYTMYMYDTQMCML